jgi:hypothetical protein
MKFSYHENFCSFMRISVHLCQRKFLNKHLRFSIHVTHVSFIPPLVVKSYTPCIYYARTSPVLLIFVPEVVWTYLWQINYFFPEILKVPLGTGLLKSKKKICGCRRKKMCPKKKCALTKVIYITYYISYSFYTPSTQNIEECIESVQGIVLRDEH